MTAQDPDQKELLVAHYDEFRRVARGVLNGDAAKLQIQPTDLAHAAAIKIFDLNRMDVRGRTHFLSLSARIMRQILMDELRRLRAAKRQAPPVTTQWPGEGEGAVERVVRDALERGYDGAFSIEPHMVAVFHDAKSEAQDDSLRENFVTYGRKLEELIHRVSPSGVAVKGRG